MIEEDEEDMATTTGQDSLSELRRKAIQLPERVAKKASSAAGYTSRCSEPVKCRYSANQYGAYIRFCDDHGRMVKAACKALNITPSEFLDRAVDAWIRRHVDGQV